MLGLVGQAAIAIKLPWGQAATPNCCGPGCRGNVGAAAHYDEDYFKWQKKLGLAQVKDRNYMKMLNVQPTDTVLDFGAGSGAVLSSLDAGHNLVAVE